MDEAGFLGARQAERLLDVADELRQRGVRVKLHLLGDSKQMQGIQAGNLAPLCKGLDPREGRQGAPVPTSYSTEPRGLLKITRELTVVT
ncbi:hypothetical protein [Geomonas oryzisoli]|uniref:hypothetical protein n=1 Tax=Geomonas oryzisoli TaxID=2847992 RepID=UPI0034631566